jgi:hypothetical protein
MLHGGKAEESNEVIENQDGICICKWRLDRTDIIHALAVQHLWSARISGWSVFALNAFFGRSGVKVEKSNSGAVEN